MKGKFPDILNNPQTGETARKLYDDAQAMLDRIIEEKWLTANAVFGFFPANAVGDAIEVYADDARTEVLAGPAPRCASRASTARACPTGRWATSWRPKETGLADHVGAFAVTAGLGIQERIMKFKADLDDYSAILLESLADRLAEAFAERLHQRVRTEFWGYDSGETLANEDLIAEKYRGIRPAPGYPACPEHTEKQTLWELLDVEATTGIELTESMAMWPGAAVSGWYFSHPQSQYFVVGRLGRDQVADYAERKGWTLVEAERWLSAEPRLRPGGLRALPDSQSSPPAAVLWDMDGTLVDTEPYWIETEFALAEEYGGTWSRELALELVGNDLLDLGALHPQAHGDRPDPRGDRGAAARRGDRAGAHRGAVAAGRPRAARAAARGRGAVRPGDDVVRAVRGADPGAPARRDVPCGRDRRRRHPRQARIRSPT